MTRRRDPRIRLPREVESMTYGELAGAHALYSAGAPEPEGEHAQSIRATMDGWQDHARPRETKPVQHERAAQHALQRAVRLKWWSPFWWHVGNERWGQAEAHAMAAAGVRTGVPDNWIAVPAVPGYPGALAAAELKGPTGHLSSDQRARLVTLSTLGFRVAVHRDWAEQLAFFHEAAGPNPGREAIDAALAIRNNVLVADGLLPRTRKPWPRC